MQALVYEMGFDLHPHLTEMSQAWKDFINEICSHYSNDPNVVDEPTKLTFIVPDAPPILLIKDPLAFRRFSSTIPETNDIAVNYIQSVFEIACHHFKSNVHLWMIRTDGVGDPSPIYSWPQVYQPLMRMYAQQRKSTAEFIPEPQQQ